MRITKSDISLELECWVEELSPAQLAQYEKVTNEHNAIKNALKTALSANEGKELFAGQVFQAYSFKGKVLQELKEATLPQKPPKAAAPQNSNQRRKRNLNYVYLESSDEEEDDVPLAKRIASAGKKSGGNETPKGSPANAKTPLSSRQKGIGSSGKSSPQPTPTGKGAKSASTPAKSGGVASPSTGKNATPAKGAASTSPPVRPSESTAIGGLVIGTDAKDKDGKDGKDTGKETKLQGKTFPSLVVLAKPWLKVKDMSATRSKLDSKVKLVLMLTPNKFTEWLIQEGLLKAEQRCSNHKNNELKLGVFSDATKFPFTGGYVWISECCPMRLVSVFHGSIFEGAPHPPSCILKLIYHWSCQTNIQNVVQWVKVDNVYIKGVYTWLRAVCTLAVQQKCKKLGGPDKFVEVGVISLGTTSQDGQQRQVKVEVLGVLDHAEKTIRLRAVEPLADGDRNYKRRFQTILEPLQRWVHKDSIICIDLTVDKMTLYSMGFKNIVQAAATDNTAKHTNSAVMDYLRRIVPRMFQNTLSLLSRQMIQQFLDELVWREHFGTYALQAFNSITSHIAEQTRMNTNETLTQRLYQVATNPFKDWSVLPANLKETPANTQPKRLKKPINEADYLAPTKVSVKNIKKEKDSAAGQDKSANTPQTSGRRRGAATSLDEDYRPEKKSKLSTQTTSGGKISTPQRGAATTKASPAAAKKSSTQIETKHIKKEEDDLKGLEEMYYGVRNGNEENFESFPFKGKSLIPVATTVDCPICDINESYDSNEKLQTHLVSHIIIDGKDHQFQCLFCLEKHATESVLSKHNQIMHPTETKTTSSASYHCLICQNRFNSLHHLTVHLQKMHSMLELPYSCQACGYRSSSQRDVVRHFYDDHKNQNFLQCPFCLDIFRFCYRGQVNISNIEIYYMHLRQHVGKKDAQLRCQKCALSFVEKGALKQHLANHHTSLLRSAASVQKLLKNSLLIPTPKVRSHHRDPLPFSVQQKFGDFYAFIYGKFCAECNAEIINEDHFIGLLKCNKCNYKTCCERAMFEHSADCAGGASSTRDLLEMPLPNEMHCICGFSSAIGNKMAQHLAVCGQKTAYTSHEMAQENLVKRNMLDMLGLVRRDGEAGTEDEETNEQNENDENEQQQQQPQSQNQNVSEEEEQQQQQQQEQEQQQQAADTDEQAPIQFGEMEAAPVIDPEQSYAETDAQQQSQEQEQEQQQQLQPLPQQQQLELQDQVQVQDQQPQFTISFGQAGDVVQSHAEIGMPMIADLADPNPPPTPQFLGDVHTPMFDAVAAAEQQHYYHQSDQDHQLQ